MSGDARDYRQLEFVQSRIPAQDALEALVPSGAEQDAELMEAMGRTGFSRWYPVEGGHRLVTLYEGGPYNAARFTLLKGGWDHEHCSRCGAAIQPMTVCWVTRTGPFVLLDERCHGEIFGDPSEPR